jgi:adenylate cyclase
MKSRIIFWLNILLFFSFSSFAQQDPVDSLKKALTKAAEDTNKVNLLIDLSGKHLATDPDQALKYAEEAKALAEKLNYHSGKGWALKKIGQVHNIQSNYVEALQAWKEALAVFEEHGIKSGASNMLNNIGVVYYNKSMEDSAQTYYLKSLTVAEELKDTVRISTALLNLGTVYSNKKQTYDKALEYYHRGLLLGEAINNPDYAPDIIGTSAASIGEIYLNRAIKDTVAEDKKIYIDSSLIYLFKARKVYTGSTNLPYALNIIGKVYREMKDFDKAIEYHQQARDTAKMLDEKLEMAQALLGIAETDTAKKDYKSAITVYGQAEKLFREIGLEESYDLEKVYEGLSAAYSELKDFGSAFRAQTALIDVRKKIYDLEVDKKLATKLFAFDIEKKQGEINLKQSEIGKQKLLRNSFMGGFAVVLLFAGVFLTQRNRIKKEKKRSDELLLNILPEETAEELKATGSAKAKSFDSVTVLFTDFKNFTQAAEKLSPEELVREINHCYSEFDRIVTKYRIEKIKTIGDAYMCAGGVACKQ